MPLNDITDDSEVIGVTLPVHLKSYLAYMEAGGQDPLIDDNTPGEVAAYVEKLRHLAVTDRQLMLAIVEKAIVLGGARENEYGVSVHPDDLKTIRIDGSRLSDYRIGKLGQTLERNNLGSLDPDGVDTRLCISSVHFEMAWSELKAYADTKGATLASFILDLKFGLLG